MKQRIDGFLSTDLIAHASEQFDYISELHEYLWRFVRVHQPGASGDLRKIIDKVIESAEAENIQQP